MTNHLVNLKWNFGLNILQNRLKEWILEEPGKYLKCSYKPSVLRQEWVQIQSIHHSSGFAQGKTNIYQPQNAPARRHKTQVSNRKCMLLDAIVKATTSKCLVVHCHSGICLRFSHFTDLPVCIVLLHLPSVQLKIYRCQSQSYNKQTDPKSIWVIVCFSWTT